MNTWEARARARKAYKLARFLYRELYDARRIDRQRIVEMSAESRQACATLVDVARPSEATWAAAFGILDEMIAEAASPAPPSTRGRAQLHSERGSRSGPQDSGIPPGAADGPR